MWVDVCVEEVGIILFTFFRFCLGHGDGAPASSVRAAALEVGVLLLRCMAKVQVGHSGFEIIVSYNCLLYCLLALVGHVLPSPGTLSSPGSC